MSFRPDARTGDAAGEAKRILVVDDDEVLREALCAALEQEGYEAAGVANGKEALDYLRREKAPCVVLLDLMMPVMDGWEFRAEQSRDPSIEAVPVVVLSAVARAADQALRGVKRFFDKPVDLSDLLDEVRAYCG